MRRGTIVTVALPGDYGKPRPAVVIQPERLAATDSLLVCPLTSTQRDAAPLPPRRRAGRRERPSPSVRHHGRQDHGRATRTNWRADRISGSCARSLRSTAYWRSRSGSPTGPGRTARRAQISPSVKRPSEAGAFFRPLPLACGQGCPPEALSVAAQASPGPMLEPPPLPSRAIAAPSTREAA